MRETNQVCLPTGNVLLKFAVEEIEEFAEIVDDIVTVISSNSIITTHVCESCGSTFEKVSYDEPEGEDLQ